MAAKAKKSTFSRRMRSMLKVDFRRMLTTPLFYIMVGVSVIVPILVIVMTTMMDGTVTVNQQTGVETVMEAFDSTWQIIASPSGAGMSMDITSMCNINLVYFMLAVFVCLFVADDFKSGYAKNLFTVRADKADYVVSKTLAGFVCGVFMLLGFFVGAMLGGMFAGLSFELVGATAGNVVMCMLSKLLLTAVFVPMYLTMSVFAKQKSWLSILLSMLVGMFLFMMIPLITPLDTTFVNVILCMAGGIMFSIGLGIASKSILSKRDIL